MNQPHEPLIFQTIKKGGHTALKKLLTTDPNSSFDTSSEGENALEYAIRNRKSECVSVLLTFLKEPVKQFKEHASLQIKHEKSINNESEKPLTAINYFTAYDQGEHGFFIPGGEIDLMSGLYAISYSALMKQWFVYFKQLSSKFDYLSSNPFCFNPFLCAMLVMTEQEKIDYFNDFKNSGLTFNDKSFELYKRWLAENKFPSREKIISQVISLHENGDEISDLATRAVYYYLKAYLTAGAKKKNKSSWIAKAEKAMSELKSCCPKQLSEEELLRTQMKMECAVAYVCQANKKHREAKIHFKNAGEIKFPEGISKDKSAETSLLRLDYLSASNQYLFDGNPKKLYSLRKNQYVQISLAFAYTENKESIVPIQKTLIQAGLYLFMGYERLAYKNSDESIKTKADLFNDAIKFCEQSEDPCKEHFSNYHLTLGAAYAGLGLDLYEEESFAAASNKLILAIKFFSEAPFFSEKYRLSDSYSYLLLTCYSLLATICFKLESQDRKLEYFVAEYDHLLPQLLNKMQRVAVNKIMKEERETFYKIHAQTQMAKLFKRWGSYQESIQRCRLALKLIERMPLYCTPKGQVIGCMREKYNDVKRVTIITDLVVLYAKLIDVIKISDLNQVKEMRGDLNKLKNTKIVKSFFKYKMSIKLEDILKKNAGNLKKRNQTKYHVVKRAVKNTETIQGEKKFEAFKNEVKKLGKLGFLCDARSADNSIWFTFVKPDDRGKAFGQFKKYTGQGYSLQNVFYKGKCWIELNIDLKKPIKRMTFNILFEKIEKSLSYHDVRTRNKRQGNDEFEIIPEALPKKKKSVIKRSGSKKNIKPFRYKSKRRGAGKAQNSKNRQHAMSARDERKFLLAELSQKSVKVEKATISKFLTLTPAAHCALMHLAKLCQLSNKLIDSVSLFNDDGDASKSFLYNSYMCLLTIYDGLYLHSRSYSTLETQLFKPATLARLRSAVHKMYLLDVNDIEHLLAVKSFVNDTIIVFRQAFDCSSKIKLHRLGSCDSLLQSELLKITAQKQISVNYSRYILKICEEMTRVNTAMNQNGNVNNESLFFASKLFCRILLDCFDNLPSEYLKKLRIEYPYSVLLNREYTNLIQGLDSSRIRTNDAFVSIGQLNDEYVIQALKNIKSITMTLKKILSSVPMTPLSFFIWNEKTPWKNGIDLTSSLPTSHFEDPSSIDDSSSSDCSHDGHLSL